MWLLDILLINIAFGPISRTFLEVSPPAVQRFEVSWLLEHVWHRRALGCLGTGRSGYDIVDPQETWMLWCFEMGMTCHLVYISSKMTSNYCISHRCHWAKKETCLGKYAFVTLLTDAMMESIHGSMPSGCGVSTVFR